MIKIENVETAGWNAALRGMRNPMNSWDKADSGLGQYSIQGYKNIPLQNNFFYHAGPNDHALAMRLRNAGTDHRKFMRMIVCYADITAPLYWWKEFDTYRMGVEKNSCSTMHKIAEKEFTLDDFSIEHLDDSDIQFEIPEEGDDDHVMVETTSAYTVLCELVGMLNAYRERYIDTESKTYWWQMIQLLPSSYNQHRTVMMSYEALANMYHARKHHKLDEWLVFCRWVESLPYSELITGGGTEK